MAQNVFLEILHDRVQTISIAISQTEKAFCVNQKNVGKNET